MYPQARQRTIISGRTTSSKHPLVALTTLSGPWPIHPRTHRDQTHYWTVYLNSLVRRRNVIEPNVTLVPSGTVQTCTKQNKPSVATWLRLWFLEGSSIILHYRREFGNSSKYRVLKRRLRKPSSHHTPVGTHPFIFEEAHTCTPCGTSQHRQLQRGRGGNPRLRDFTKTQHLPILQFGPRCSSRNLALTPHSEGRSPNSHGGIKAPCYSPSPRVAPNIERSPPGAPWMSGDEDGVRGSRLRARKARSLVFKDWMDPI